MQENIKAPIDFEALKQYRNRANAFANYIGFQIDKLDEGYAEGRMKLSKEHRNPIGSVHGGCLYTCADVAGGTAASTYGDRVTTLDSTIQYLRPGLLDSTELIATGKVLKRGRRAIVSQIEIKDQNGKLLCTGTFTFMVLHLEGN